MNPPAVRIDVDGTVTPLADLEYDTLKAALDGGWLEAAPTDERLTIWIDEEGKIKGLPYNAVADTLWAAVGKAYAYPGDRLVGPAVITGGTDDEGDTLPVSPEILALVDVARQIVVGDDPNVKVVSL